MISKIKLSFWNPSRSSPPESLSQNKTLRYMLGQYLLLMTCISYDFQLSSSASWAISPWQNQNYSSSYSSIFRSSSTLAKFLWSSSLYLVGIYRYHISFDFIVYSSELLIDIFLLLFLFFRRWIGLMRVGGGNKGFFSSFS